MLRREAESVNIKKYTSELINTNLTNNEIENFRETYKPEILMMYSAQPSARASEH